MYAPSRTWAPAGLIAVLAVATVSACGSSAGAPLTSPVVVCSRAIDDCGRAVRPSVSPIGRAVGRNAPTRSPRATTRRVR